jgi:prepilin-type N-terminal cleavage/methylation domain-containing protein
MSRREGGFTLMEVLVVMLILGVLAGLALPTILKQKDKGHEEGAKSNARNLVTHVESCHAQTDDYRNCQNSDLDVTGLVMASADGATPANGEASVEETPSAQEFTVAATSSTGVVFRITRGSGGGYTRSCTPDSLLCKSGTW